MLNMDAHLPFKGIKEINYSALFHHHQLKVSHSGCSFICIVLSSSSASMLCASHAAALVVFAYQLVYLLVVLQFIATNAIYIF
jgi:hypothetical protein